MKEYIEREALMFNIAAKFEKHYGKSRGQAIHDFYKCVVKRICAAPAADVVEVVRCKDCKHYAAMIADTVSGNMQIAPWGICTQPWFDSDEYDVDENGYCSNGERKDKEE